VQQGNLEIYLRGFSVNADDVGSVVIDLHQPFGKHFDLVWGQGGQIRVPVPTNDQYWTLSIASDGLANWDGKIDLLQLRMDGNGPKPVQIRSVSFLRHGDSYPEPVGIRRAELDREIRNVVYAHAPAEVRFHAVPLPSAAKLHFGMGRLAGDTSTGGGDSAIVDEPLRFAVEVSTDAGSKAVFEGSVAARGKWQDVGVSLQPWGGQTVAITLRITGGAAGEVALWSNPIVYQPVAEPPCAIVYLIDALAAHHSDLYGHDRATMPRLREEASQGVLFANMFSNSPRTVESVPDLMLSMPTRQHRVSHPSAAADPELVTLAEVMRAAGFATASFCTNVNAGPRQNMDQGFDHFFDRIAYWWDGDVDRTVPIEDVLAWLGEHRDRPCMIYIHTAEPHAPYTPPEGFAGRYDAEYDGRYDGTYDQRRGFRNVTNPRDLAHVSALYDEEVAYADSRLGKFWDALEGTGFRQRTHLFVISDHGEEFQEHGAWEHGPNLHRETTRIPFVALGPGFQRGKSVEAPVQLYDLMPTILDLFDLPEPYTLEGDSVLALLQGPSTAEASEPEGAERQGVDWAERAIIGSNFTYRDAGVIEYFVVGEGRWKLMLGFDRMEPATRSRFLLYDLQKDPGEQHNVIAQHPEVARELIGRLIEHHRATAPFKAGALVNRLLMDAGQLRELRSLGYVE
jgi:arylsulfatase A-like enzyme